MNNMEAIKEIWLSIPGLPGYEISNQLRLKSYRASKEGRIRKGNSKYEKVNVMIEGRFTSFSVKRLYIAAKNGISPMELDRNVFVRGTAEHPILVTREDNAREIANKKKKMCRTIEESLAYLEQAKIDLDALTDYYKTGNMESVTQLVLRYKSNVIGYLFRTNRVYSMDGAEEVWSEAVAKFIDKLSSGKIGNPIILSYLRGIVRRVIDSRRVEKKRLISYIDSFAPCK